MKFLKALVVIMGILIIVGVAVIAVELYKRANDPERAAGKAVVDRAEPPTTGTTALGLPAGARIGAVVAVGSRAVVTVSLPGGEDRLYTLDPRTGAISPVLTTGDAGTLSAPDPIPSIAR